MNVLHMKSFSIFLNITIYFLKLISVMEFSFVIICVSYLFFVLYLETQLLQTKMDFLDITLIATLLKYHH